MPVISPLRVPVDLGLVGYCLGLSLTSIYRDYMSNRGLTTRTDSNRPKPRSADVSQYLGRPHTATQTIGRRYVDCHEGSPL